MCEVVVNDPKSVTIDSAGVTSIDADRKVLLAQLSQPGAELRAFGCMTRCVVEEIIRGGDSTQ